MEVRVTLGNGLLHIYGRDSAYLVGIANAIIRKAASAASTFASVEATTATRG